MYYLPEVVTNKLETHLGKDIIEVQPISGGDINEARLLKTQDGQAFFVKLNAGPGSYDLLTAESRGLDLLRQAAPAQLVIPEVLACGEAGTTAYLLLEYIPTGKVSPGFWESFGRGLANLHRQTQENFGLDHANFIGRLSQENQYHQNWAGFYTEQRLLPQARLAYQQELLDLKDMQQLDRLCKQLSAIYPLEPPALIHGDLWNGNYLVHPNGSAVLIDPAVSYSHREMDVAMTRLFGGFPSEFYAAYHATYPLHSGWEDRLPVGQLYYLLVHLNMFGVGYLPAVRRTIKGF